MFGDYPPDAENTRGARWNPPGVAAIYTSLAREGALAEAEHQIAIQPVPPRARRTIYTLKLALTSVLDLTDVELLRDLGVGAAELAADDMTTCRQLGGAAHWLERDGLLLPSARSSNTNAGPTPAHSGFAALLSTATLERISRQVRPSPSSAGMPSASAVSSSTACRMIP